jgi:hypothetical protein
MRLAGRIPVFTQRQENIIMYQTITFSDFCDAFRSHGRENQFSYDGLRVIFDYLEGLEDDLGEPIEFDVIAICCEFSEDNFAEIAENYDIDLTDCDDMVEKISTVEEYLNDYTSIAGETSAGTFVYQQF